MLPMTELFANTGGVIHHTSVSSANWSSRITHRNWFLERGSIVFDTTCRPQHVRGGAHRRAQTCACARTGACRRVQARAGACKRVQARPITTAPLAGGVSLKQKEVV